MREGLREIAQHAPSDRIVFLGQETHVVAKCEKILEERGGSRISDDAVGGISA
jgi:hypothetical protein